MKTKPLLIICGTIVILVGMSLGYSAFREAKQVIEKPVNTACELASEAFDKLTTENREIGVRVGNYLKETAQQRFQFKQRDALLLFQIIRWRNKKGTAFSEEQPGLIDKKGKDIFLGQYTLAEAKGDFEITFYIELHDQEKWRYDWNTQAKRLTVTTPSFTPPNVGCNTPAEIRPLQYKVLVDSTTLDEGRTIELLKEAIPRLKRDAALRQLAHVREDARKSLNDFFMKLIPNMLGAQENDINIKIVFADETSESRDTFKDVKKTEEYELINTF